MKYDVLKMTRDKFKKLLLIYLSVCVFFIVSVLILNICLSVFRTDDTHTTFLIVNIVTDIAVFWVEYTFIGFVLLPKYRKLLLYDKAQKYCEEITVKFVGFAQKQRVEKFDCVTAEFEYDDGMRKVFVIRDTFENAFSEGKIYRIGIANNIVVMSEAAE